MRKTGKLGVETYREEETEQINGKGREGERRAVIEGKERDGGTEEEGVICTVLFVCFPSTIYSNNHTKKVKWCH